MTFCESVAPQRYESTWNETSRGPGFATASPTGRHNNTSFPGNTFLDPLKFYPSFLICQDPPEIYYAPIPVDRDQPANVLFYLHTNRTGLRMLEEEQR